MFIMFINGKGKGIIPPPQDNPTCKHKAYGKCVRCENEKLQAEIQRLQGVIERKNERIRVLTEKAK